MSGCVVVYGTPMEIRFVLPQGAPREVAEELSRLWFRHLLFRYEIEPMGRYSLDVHRW